MSENWTVREARDIPYARAQLWDSKPNCSAVITCDIGWSEFKVVCVTVEDAFRYLDNLASGQGVYGMYTFRSIKIGTALDLLRDTIYE
jgi:hypothetical protein